MSGTETVYPTGSLASRFLPVSVPQQISPPMVLQALRAVKYACREALLLMLRWWYAREMVSTAPEKMVMSSSTTLTHTSKEPCSVFRFTCFI